VRQLSAVPLPVVDAATGLVHLVGVVLSKRQIGRALVFANIVPPREGMHVASQVTSEPFLKHLPSPVNFRALFEPCDRLYWSPPPRLL